MFDLLLWLVYTRGSFNDRCLVVPLIVLIVVKGRDRSTRAIGATVLWDYRMQPSVVSVNNVLRPFLSGCFSSESKPVGHTF